MCGIYSLLNGNTNELNSEHNKKLFMKGSNRGPENTNYSINHQFDFTLGFHRLAINGYKDAHSEQPFHIKNISLICNGEIYNYKQLYKVLDVIPHSRSDCEVIIHSYIKYGIKQTLQLLDGVYAFTLVDLRKDIPKIYIARDTYGIRPLFQSKIKGDKNPSWLFASEMKQMTIKKKITPVINYDFDKIEQFQPGTYTCFYWNKTSGIFTPYCENTNTHLDSIKHIRYSSPNTFTNFQINTEEYACSIIRNSLIDAVQKRVDNTERDIACLLSGGLDSSLIAALVNNCCPPGKLHTWSIGFKGSEDIRYAEMVAKHLGTNHHSIIVEESEFLNAIENVIYTIESYDTTTVRASVGNWLISKYIRENSHAKVVFNGDGSDELTGGYMYFHCAPDEYEFDKECRRLLSDIHYFDVLRSDRSISSHGLEARTPFLDRSFVENYLSIPPHIRFHPKNQKCEKYLLRKSFENDNLLPNEVLWRTKEAFSDGVSKQSRSWYSIIQEYCHRMFSMPDNTFTEKSYIEQTVKLMKMDSGVPPKTLEQLHYRMIFDKYYKNHSSIIPYFWMPRYVNATDSSARTLNIYKEKTKDSINGENTKKISNEETVSYT